VPTLLLGYQSLVRQPSVELEANHALAGNPMRFRKGRVPLRLHEEWRQSLSRGQRLLTLGATWPLLFRYGDLGGAGG
jgi:hypothetical protein